VALLLLLVPLGAAAAGWVWWSYRLPEPGAVPTVRLLAGTTELAALHGAARRAQLWVPLERMPQPVIDAVLAAEDRRFFQHAGIDVLAVLRASMTNLRSAEVVQGGSTITQQLARTLFLDTERTWARKLRETAIALVLERRYPKSRILESYLNSVYLGHDGDVAVHGVAAAARHFLGKELGTIRLEEAALLAAAIRAPNRILSGDAGRARAERDGVLRAMSQHGLVSEAAAGEALARPVRRQAAGAAVRAPYFVDLARQEIARRVSLPDAGEVRVATSLDPALQRTAEVAVRAGLERIERQRPALRGAKLQAALVAIEPASGQIRALVGGRRYLDSQFNRALRARRQPGSLFKPFVYLAAFEATSRAGAGPLTPATLIADEPLTIPAADGGWSPRNIDGRFQGPVTVRRALEHSLNVPAARVAQDVGLDQVRHVAGALGIESPLAAVPSLALGTSEVTLLEITTAFATLANGGVRVRPTTLDLEAMLAGGPAVTPAPPAARAVSGESAFLITHLLRGVMQHGTGAASARWGLSDLTAGKTGTTDGLRDAWFVGYTRDLAVGVWVGTDDAAPLGLTGSEAALPIWAAVMQHAVRRVPPRPFAPPPGIVLASVERDTGRRPAAGCDAGPVITEAFREGSLPEEVTCAMSVPSAVAGHLLDWVRQLFR
jgi:penicillin-binding protein 1B